MFTTARRVLVLVAFGFLGGSVLFASGCASTRSTAVEQHTVRQNDSTSSNVTVDDGLERARLWFGDESLGR